MNCTTPMTAPAPVDPKQLRRRLAAIYRNVNEISRRKPSDDVLIDGGWLDSDGGDWVWPTEQAAKFMFPEVK